VSLAACNRGTQSKDAVRQGVLDYLSSKGLNMSGMNVDVTAVQFNGDRAEASVSITAKGTQGGGMSPVYVLEQKGGKWAVTGRKDLPGEAPHGGGAAMPGATNPHGGAMPAPPAADPGGKMPSPEDLPPAGKKK
jgi:hypothetical protein